MKIDLPTSDAQGKQSQFGIGDLAVILEILRSKMYSNPIRTVCQEIMSNSRDAHVEAGKADLPIEISIVPTSQYSIAREAIRFRDYGPGISPDRMANVFLLYGSSTKRGSDMQVGGYGLGAKSPFAYSDIYRITSITPDADRMVKRVYEASIDKSRVGTLTMVSESETTERQGTMIEVPVKTGDTPKFLSSIAELTQHWRVRPHADPRIEYKQEDYKYRTASWSIPEKTTSYNYETLATIEGIPYKIPHETMRMIVSGNKDFTALVEAGIELHFRTGDLRVTANRENIDLTDEAIGVIKGHLIRADEELHSIVDAECAALPSMAAAMKLYRKVYKLPVKVMYAGAIVNFCVLTGPDIKRYTRQVGSPNGFKADKLCRENEGEYTSIKVADLFASDTILVECDEYSINRLIGIFKHDPKINHLILASFEDSAHRAKINAQFKWDLLAVPKLSAFPKVKAGGKPPSTAGTKISGVKVFEPSMAPHWQSSDQDLATGKGVYVVIDGGKAIFGERTLSNANLEFLIHNIPDVSSDFKVHGILKARVSKIGPGWKTLESHMREVFESLKARLGARLIDADRLRIWNSREKEWFDKMLAKLPSDHFFNKWKAATAASDAVTSVYDKARRLQTMIKAEGLSIGFGEPLGYYAEFITRYPMVYVGIQAGTTCISDSFSSEELAQRMYEYVLYEDSKVA